MVKKAEDLAAKQREIGVAEFFSRNRHLLGFDNPRKALLTVVKEAVDNALDACEEARILPEVIVEVIDMKDDRFKVIVEDNGPGILKSQIPKIFAKLLYGSKFHSLKQTRGQQGIGISAAVMYGQLTTGKSAKITSRAGKNKPAHYMELHIDTQKNQPEILKEEETPWEKEHGTRIEIDLEGSYAKGAQSVDEYLKQTAITNPHVTIIYSNPKAEQIIFPRATDLLPPESKEIKPHIYGVELGVLLKMLRVSKARTLQSFLSSEFSRIGSGTAKDICQKATLLPNTKPQEMSREQAELLMKGVKKTKLMNPPTDCIAPIGEEELKKGMRKEINAEFYTTVTRKPNVYRGNPFTVEIGIAYGGAQKADSSVRIIRYANRVPLLYQQGACASTKAIAQTGWRSYGLSQSQNSVPIGPVTIAVHIASVWVPFTSESKEAIAHYPEILKEMKLALQDAGRKLGSYVNKKKRMQKETKTRSFIQTFIPHVGEALQELLGFSKTEEKKVEEMLGQILEKQRGKLESTKFDPKANVDYNEELASVGKEEQNEQKEE